MEKRIWTPMRRAGAYALIGAIAGAIPGTVAMVVGPNDTSPALIFAAAGLAAVAGYMFGKSQPVAYNLSFPKQPEGRPGIWGFLGRTLYRLGMGLLLGLLYAGLAEMLWVNVLFALEGPAANSPRAPLTPLRRAAGLACGNAMVGSVLAAFVASWVGAFLGGAVRTARYAPPIVWVAAWSGALGLLLGSNAGAVSGIILPFEVAFLVTLSSSVPTGIAAALIVWILVKRKLTAAEP